MEFRVHGPRANWKGFLRLSLVTCPVALYPGTSESEKISLINSTSRLAIASSTSEVDADTGEEVPNEDIFKAMHSTRTRSSKSARKSWRTLRWNPLAPGNIFYGFG